MKRWLKWLVEWTQDSLSFILNWKKEEFNIKKISDLEKIIEGAKGRRIQKINFWA